jgi:hypothetical protein
MLRWMLPPGRRAEWLPVPSNVPQQARPERVATVRSWAAPRGELLVGHFGTYGGLISPLLGELLSALLTREPKFSVLLLGRGGERFAADALRRRPGCEGQMRATGGLAPQDLADHLAACDLLLQPYPDGVTARRGSLMAGLGLGLPVLSNRGPLTEPVWESLRAVALADDPTPGAYAPHLDALLASADRRRDLARCGAEVYRRRFAIERTLAVLLGTEAPASSFCA